MRTKTAFLVSVLLVVCIACGGGETADRAIGGGSGGSTNLAASFNADQVDPLPNSITMAYGGASGNLVTVQVNVTEAADVFGVDFDVVFDPTMVQFVNWRPGTVLETGGQPVSYLVEAAQPGRLVVGASRQGAGAGGTDVYATRSLIEFTFRAIAAGSSGLKFESATLFNSQSPPRSISGISWAGGTVTAN